MSRSRVFRSADQASLLERPLAESVPVSDLRDEHANHVNTHGQGGGCLPPGRRKGMFDPWGAPDQYNRSPAPTAPTSQQRIWTADP